MKNLLENTNIATIFLDDRLSIRRFTHEATKVYRLADSDTGRPLADIRSLTPDVDLIPEAAAVLFSLIPRERQVRTIDNEWYLVRIIPYRTLENVIGGVVLTFSNITALKAVEAALQEEQQFSQLMLDSLPGIFYLYTYPEHQLTRWNKLHETLLGYTADEMKGKLAFDWHLPELKDAVLKATEEVMEKGQGSVESNLIAKDGHTIPFFLTGVRFEAKGRLYYMGTGIDITERKKAEEAFRASENRYHTIYDQSPIAIELYDVTGTLVHMNMACLTLFGIDNMQVIQNFSLFADPNISNEQKEKLRQGETVQYQGPFDFNKVKTLNLYPTSRDGIIWLDVLITPLGNHPDSVAGFLVQIQDITERKRAEEALLKNTEELHASNEELTATDEELRQTIDELGRTELALRSLSTYNRSLIEAGMDPLVTINPDGKIADVNTSTEKVTGYSRKELIGTDFSDYFTEPEKAKEGYLQVFAAGTVRDYPLSIKNRDGHITPVLYNASVYRDETGKVSGVFAAARDITERKQTEELLFKKNEE
ncbi:MAG: PAS domain S-box protein, partial [Methanomicrobiales archaeon]